MGRSTNNQRLSRARATRPGLGWIQLLLHGRKDEGTRRTERSGDAQKDAQGRLALTAFELAVVGAVNAGGECECILSNTPFDTHRTGHTAKRPRNLWVKGGRSRRLLLVLRGGLGDSGGRGHRTRLPVTQSSDHGIYAVPERRANVADVEGKRPFMGRQASEAPSRGARAHGHGKRPNWFKDLLAAGKTAEDLLVK